MKCPLDGEALVMTERQGIEIDYCPKCRGVWLDRGELDKIIERASPGAPPPPPQASAYPGDPRSTAPGGLFGAPPPPPPRGEPIGWGRRDDDDDDHHHDPRHRGYGQSGGQHGQSFPNQPSYPPRRKSMLGELFDFD